MDNMIVKLKIPAEAAANELYFRCPFCNKSFRSGMALGGHKRIHNLQKDKNESHVQPGRELQVSNLEAEAPEKTLKCPVCDHIFVSNKALHGHMRKHRQRNWRGMKPPIEEAGDGNSLLPVSDSAADGQDPADQSEEEKQLDFDLLSSGWQKTGRRSSWHEKAPMNISAPHHQELTMSGVYDLISLPGGGGKPGKQDFDPKKKKLELSISSSAGNSGLSSSKNIKPVVLGGGNYLEIRNNLGPKSSIRGENPLLINDENAYKNPIRSSQKKHICTICNRSFKSYQALGGHKSHHSINGIRSSGQDGASGATAAGTVSAYMGCSGQATEGEKEIHNQPTVLSFDLNELPPEWIDP